MEVTRLSPARKTMRQLRREPTTKRGTMQHRRSSRQAPPSPTSVADLYPASPPPSPHRSPKSCSSTGKKKLRLRSPSKASPKGSTSPRYPVTVLSRGTVSQHAASLNLLVKPPGSQTPAPIGLRTRTTMTGRPHTPFYDCRPTTAAGSPLSDWARRLLHQRMMEHRGRANLATNMEGDICRRRQMYFFRLDSAATHMQSWIRGWRVRCQLKAKGICIVGGGVSVVLPTPRISTPKSILKHSQTQRRRKTRSRVERKSKAERSKIQTYDSLSPLSTSRHGKHGGKRVQFAGLGPSRASA